MAAKTIEVDIKGMRETLFRIAELSERAEERVKAQIRESAKNIMDDAKQRCPVDTGELRDSIEANIEDDGFAAVIGPNKKTAWRGKFIEFGTVKMAARPFLFPAFEAERPKYMRGIRKAVKGE